LSLLLTAGECAQGVDVGRDQCIPQLPINRIEQIRSAAFDQAKKTIDGIVRDRAASAGARRSL